METIQELVDERARVLNEIDDIINTARSAGRPTLDEAERARHDELAARSDELEGEIERAAVVAADADRFAAQEARRSRAVVAPMINRGADPARAGRSLDELLWATNEAVRAGTFQPDGTFVPHGNATNAVERVVVRSDSGEGVAAPRLGEFRAEHRDLVRSFQQTVADMAIFGLMVDRRARSSSEGFEVARGHRLMADRWRSICRAMDVDTAGEGGNWVPTGVGAMMHERVRASGRVAALFPRVDLPTNPWVWPLEGADAEAYRVAEPTGDSATKVTASTPGTEKATFDAEIIGARTLFSRSVEADSVLAIMPYVQSKLVRAFVDAEEKAIIDGDSDGAHQDSDVSGSTDARTLWDGLRKRGLANTNTDASNVAVTLALFRSARAKMLRWGLNPADLAAIVPIGVYYDLLALGDVTTVDKFGPQATILNGELGRLDGVPLIVSEHFRENLNASGVFDNVTTTRTGLVLVNRNEWALGQRMALDVEVDDSIYRESFQRVLVAFMREDFQSIGESTGDDTSYLFNLT